MSSGRFGFSARRGGGRRGGRDRGVVDSIREATGASVEDIQYQLQECEGDVNKATEQLIDSVPFTVVQSKKSRPKPQARGRGRGRREGPGGGRRGPEGETRGGGRSIRRGGQNPRGRNFRNRDKTTPVEKDESTTEKTKQILPPPVPMKKAYLEALCRKPKFQPPTTTIPSKTENGVESGWEEATPPPESYLHPIPVELPPEEVPTSESEAIEETPVVEESFPVAMADIRFTREDTTPIESSCLPIPMRQDLKTAGIPILNADPLDMSSFQYLFGTFSGLQKSSESEEELPLPPPVQQNLEEDPPVIPSTSIPVEEDSPVEEGTRTEEQDLPESLNSIGLRSGELEARIQNQSSMEFPSEAQLNPSTVPLESYGSNTTPPVEFRLDVGAQVLDLEVQSPPHEKPNFLSTGVQSSPVSEELPSSSNPEKANLPTSVQVLEEVEYSTKGFRGADLKSMDISLSEDLTTPPGTSFEVAENRHKTPSIVENKTMMEPESASYNITSGPTPTLPSFQPQTRHQPQTAHKLPEKTVGATPTNHQNSKYNSHQNSGGSNPIPGSGGSGGTPNHVPVVSLNPNNSSSGNPSLPMMPQLPFVNPGMIPNPAMPVPPGHLYYPQYMQYQHQMYHGMYAGTYGGFGAPFNHESVGHPAHVNPGGVPPNQGNQQFPVSFPNALYTLGNSVYDMTPNNPNSFSNTKEKESVFLAQQQQLQHGFPGGHQPVPRNDGSLFYGMPGQAAFTQGIRSQYHQPPGFAGQFPGGGVVAPPPNYHPPGQQGNNFRLP